MRLTPGTRLGVYEVGELLGAGGMGEVYRAHDTRLNRSVAIKILPDLFAIDAERLARFKREAQLLASLNHTNIAAVFGFEEANGIQALVLELVEGTTLAGPIAQGPMPLDEVFPVARQIAEALEAAHSQGIVHRDLKPSNIKLRPDGTVKVLDFGLAKALAAEATPADAGCSLTITSPAVTEIGVLLGTAAYMSPEQVRGRSVDKRTDIWAFGSVLYEMLTGKPAFDGNDMSDTLANVLKRDPDWAALPSTTPPKVRRVLRRCLEKDPRQRMHDIADARLELDAQEAETAPALTPPARRRRMFERIAWLLLLATLAGVLAYVLRRQAPSQPAVRFHVDPPENATFGSTTGVGRADGTTGSVLSPDGSQLAFVAEQAGRSQIWLRRFDGFTARPVPGTDGGMMPFWSPDGHSVGFHADGKLKVVDLADGAARTLADVPVVPRGAAWGSRDVIVFSSGTPPRLARVSARGGTVTLLESADVIYPRWPAFLPDGRSFMFLARFQSDSFLSLVAWSIEPGVAPRRLVQSDSNGAFAPPGVVLFARGASLMQQRIDAELLTMVGEATPIVDQVFFSPGVARADFSVAEGVLAFRSAPNLPNQFAWLDRSGNVVEKIGVPGNYRTPDLSPDGTRLAYTDVNQGDIVIFDLARKVPSKFTTDPGVQTAPTWFPDGSKIAYRTDGGGVYEKDTRGAGNAVQVLKEQINGPSQVSSDGKWLLFFKPTPREGMDVYILPTSGDRTPKALVQTAFAEVEPQLSPNMRWLAYASTESGRNEVYVQPFPATGERWQVSSSGGRQPLWREDGKELYFVGDDGRFYVAAVPDPSASFNYGAPKFLFDMPAIVFNALKSYIPSPDGQRFLVNMNLPSTNAPINIVYNWDAGKEK